MTFVTLGPLRAKVGYFFSTDQSTNPGPFNTDIQKLSVFIPCQRFKDDFRCKHLKSECANMILLHHVAFLKETS